MYYVVHGKFDDCKINRGLSLFVHNICNLNWQLNPLQSLSPHIYFHNHSISHWSSIYLKDKISIKLYIVPHQIFIALLQFYIY